MAKVQLWIQSDGQPRLQGARCGDCGVVSFPVAKGCIACGSIAQEIVDLSTRGSIESRTQLGDRTVCEIQLDGGPRVMGWLESRELAEIGSHVRFAPCDDQLRFVPDA